MEQASLNCLNILEITLRKQDDFVAALREHGSSLLVSSMEQLLLGINSRTLKPDHLVNIAKSVNKRLAVLNYRACRFVTYGGTMTEHALAAVKILCHVSQSPVIQAELVGLFTRDEVINFCFIILQDIGIMLNITGAFKFTHVRLC